MKKIKKALIAVAGTATLLAPLSLSAVAHAQVALDEVGDQPINLNTLPLVCNGVDGEFPFQTSEGCDLGIDKQVSVNGGVFVEADTSAEAAQAHVGDTITWKITLTDNSDEGLTPSGTVYISDILPSAGVSYVGSSATAGNYITSGFFANNWYVPLSSGLPATLTITSTSTSTGLFQNTATLVKYDTGHCDGGCAYSDTDPTNDSDDAWIDPSAGPAVLGDSTTAGTLVNTGSGAVESVIAAGLIIATGAVIFLGRSRKSQI